MEDKPKNTKIHEIFYTMDYGENKDKIDDALEWLSSKDSTFFPYTDNSKNKGTPVELKSCINDDIVCIEIIPETDDIKNIVSQANGKVKWIDTSAFERTKLLTRLAQEIEKNTSTLNQIEIVCRGILSKDTKTKAVPLLAQYFYYYSGFAVKFNQENPNWKPEGLAVGVISNGNTLSNVGLVLAPALAAGYNVVVQAGTAIFPAVAYVVELAKKVGLPEQVITLLPSDEGNLSPYLNSENVAIVALFLDLTNDKYIGINKSNKAVINLASNKTPMIVFDNADLDSAVASIADSAWSYQGLLPWSVNTVLVQENILDTFVNKLKRKLASIKVGLADDKLADTAVITGSSFDRYKKLVESAQAQGIEVFKADEKSDSFTPTLFIGGKVDTNRVLTADEDQAGNIVTVLAFRSIDEGVNLANNRRQGLAASIWTESISVANEVTRKLKVNTVWVNGYGLTTPEVALSPVKDSGVGYFGGVEGFLEYVEFQSRVEEKIESARPSTETNVSFISSAKKAQESWCRLSKLNKAKVFQKFAEYIESNKKSLAPASEEFLSKWIVDIYKCVTTQSGSSVTTYSDFNVVSFREPLGVIVIENKAEFELRNIPLIISALYEGNTVIFITNSTTSMSFYNDLTSRLPSGVFTSLVYSLRIVEIISTYKELGAYFADGVNPVYGLLPVRDSKVLRSNVYNWGSAHKVTFYKNIWSNIGKSSTCNLSSY